ncbi:MAG TPA: PBP1A family penicillin-binding protein [Longimicrobiales bacterium]
MDDQEKPEGSEAEIPVKTMSTPERSNWFQRHLKVLLVGLGVVVLVFGVLWQRCGIRGCPDVNTLKGYMPDEASTIVDYKGAEIGKLFLTRRFIVPLDTLPEYVPDAFIAMEDKRFWKHHGVDWRRVFGALAHNVKSMGIEEGSSTITMQLARNVFPDQLPASKRTVWRKLAEARVAKSIERKYGKREILQLYLNQIYFGNGAYGIEAAAQEYFGHPAAKLTLAEAATLAALPRAPSRLNPRSNRELAYEGRKLVLQRMQEQGLIDADDAEKATNAKIRLRHGTEKGNTPAPYFVEAVRQLLEDELGDAIYAKGYTIYTTLDSKLQQSLEQELSKQLQAIESGAFGTFRHRTYASLMADTTDDDDKGTKYLQGAGIFMDPRTGDIRALVGGRNFLDSEYDRALYASRQPGSAFKPFVYAAAFADGYAPTYRLMDQPIRMVLSRHQVWEPKNYDGRYAGMVTMRDALAHSRNVPTIRLAMEIGVSRVVDMARQMGLSGRIPAVPSVVLGTAEVTPMDMTSTFAAFATLGTRPAVPRYVTKVVDREGTIVWSQEPDTREVIDPAVAFETVSLMQDVVDRGTATTVRANGYRDPVAGKTGTTNDAADTWFIGLTPDLIGTVWIGFDKRQTIVPRATGGDLAAPIWARVMVRNGIRSQGWAPPAGIEMRMVDENGNVLGENCPVVGATRREYFIQGTAPVASCYPSYDPYAMTDTLGYPVDTLGTTAAEDAGWWARMRSRIFGRDGNPKEQPVETAPLDSPALRGTPTTPPAQNPPPNPNPATLPPPQPAPKPKPVPYDSLVKPKPDTTVSPDSLIQR